MELYEIGPITDRADGNKPEFERARKMLAMAGHDPRTPFDVVSEDDDLEHVTWEYCMGQSLRHILSRWDYCNEPPTFGIAMLDGWESSNGASIEYEMASSLGIPCKPYREWL